MPIIRMYDGEKFVGDIEAETVPAVGDSLWWETNGPYEVLGREWHLPPGYIEEHPHVATLHVREVEKGKSATIALPSRHMRR